MTNKTNLCQLFIERKRYLDVYIKSIKNKENLSIYGMPHVGKTQLLNWFGMLDGNKLASDKQVYITKIMTIKDRGEDSFFIFVKDIYREFIEQVNKRIKEEYIEKQKDLGFQTIQELYELQAAIEFLGKLKNDIKNRLSDVQALLRDILIRVTKRFRVVLMIDEFDNIRNWKEEHYNYIVSLITNKEIDLVCVAASRACIKYLTRDYEYSLIPFTETRIDSFNQEELKKFLKKCTEKWGVKIDTPQKKNKLLFLCGNNPHLLTVALQMNKTKPQMDLFDLFKNNREPFTEFFDDVIRFLINEEKEKEKHLSNLVKCYMTQSEDHEDVLNEYIDIGYIELISQKRNRNSIDWPDKRYEYIKTSDDGIEKKYYYTTVCPLFISYLFSRKHVLEQIKDPRDLLTGTIFTIRDVIRFVLRKEIGNDWADVLIREAYVCTKNYGAIKYYKSGNQWVKDRLLQHSHGGIITSSGVPFELTSSLPYIITIVNNSLRYNNENSILDAIELDLTCSIIKEMNDFTYNHNSHNNVFGKFFENIINDPNKDVYLRSPQWGITTPASSLTAWYEYLNYYMEVLKDYRNSISHFARTQMDKNDKNDCCGKCRILINSMYKHIYETIIML